MSGTSPRRTIGGLRQRGYRRDGWGSRWSMRGEERIGMFMVNPARRINRLVDPHRDRPDL